MKELVIIIRAQKTTFVTLLILGLLTVQACARLHDVVVPTREPEPVYDQLYPYYIEICAISQIRTKTAWKGGSPGHAVMYLKGVCRDPATKFPTVKVCDPGSVDLNDPNAGMGVSVNRNLKNSNWMAIPDRRLFIHGNLEDDQVLDEDHVKATIIYAAEQGVFDGLEVHEEYKPENEEEETLVRYLSRKTLGTDFALKFGRTVFCSRLPVTRTMLQKILNYLNDLNREYALGEADYNWSVYHDNCSHVLHNSLAAAGVWSYTSVNQTKLRQLKNLSIPANEFADLALLSMTYPIEDFDKIYQDEFKRESLLRRGWLPTRHGALFDITGVHQNNEVYDTRFKLFVLQTPVLKQKGKKIREMVNDPRFTEVKDNLLYFKSRYEAILNKRPEDWQEVPPGDSYKEARNQYYKYIELQLIDVNNKLEQLEE